VPPRRERASQVEVALNATARLVGFGHVGPSSTHTTPAHSSTGEAGEMARCMRLMFTTVENHTSPTLVDVVSCRPLQGHRIV
jgi:hypothetical protein